MDPNRKDSLAELESEMVLEGVRPMFEFTFDDDEPDNGNYHDHQGDHSHDHSHGNHEHEHDAHHDHKHDMENHDHQGDHSHGNHEHDHQHEHDGHDMENHEHDHHQDHSHDHNHGDHGDHDHQHEHHNALEFPELPEDHIGLDGTVSLNKYEKSFIAINNNLGFSIYHDLIKSDKHKAENLIFSPLSTLTSLAMVFLGARGSTSWEINELLRLDEMITFNPHLLYKGITDDLSTDQQNKLTSACFKALYIHEVTSDVFKLKIQAFQATLEPKSQALHAKIKLEVKPLGLIRVFLSLRILILSSKSLKFELEHITNSNCILGRGSTDRVLQSKRSLFLQWHH